MIHNGFNPTIHTYNMMMKSYFHGNNYEMGCATWEEMGRKGICADVDYNKFAADFSRAGRPDALSELA
ncbi:hypothetical protein HPP92_000901 [Vanilla planifolia]|uniref:Pentatricopeptide repeat-containing protein n=1 Tax=Vanilla planifolia TaxID=51239 RepID=A0A835VHH6_VANPL|nr:hypothetical protein HPP92_000901 [Vanilla planifolia]